MAEKKSISTAQDLITDLEDHRSAVAAIREQLELGLRAYGELMRLQSAFDLAVRAQTIDPEVHARLRVRDPSGDDFGTEVSRFGNALYWLRILDRSDEIVAAMRDRIRPVAVQRTASASRV